MPPKPKFPVIAVTGLAFEARIAKGPGVHSVLGTHPARLSASITEAIKAGCQGIVSFGICGGLAPHFRFHRSLHRCGPPCRNGCDKVTTITGK